jgi:hypothetical protein
VAGNDCQALRLGGVEHTGADTWKDAMMWQVDGNGTTRWFARIRGPSKAGTRPHARTARHVINTRFDTSGLGFRV